MAAGYSATPLFRKLGLKPGMRAIALSPPDHYSTLLGTDAASVDWVSEMGKGLQFIHLFTRSAKELQNLLPICLEHLDRSGMIWVSWPKKASKVQTDIVEDTISAVCLPLGLVDVKVCAVDDIWSGLKLMIRTELR